MHLAEERHEGRIADELSEPLRPHPPEQAHGVVARLLPHPGVHPAEQVAGPLVPGPPQVLGEGAERGQRLGEPGPDREAAQRLHGPPTYRLRRQPSAGGSTLGPRGNPEM